MIARLAIAAAVTVTTLTGVAWQRAGMRDGVRPSLLVFTDPAKCDPCRRFDAAFAGDPQFRDALTQAFRCHPAYTPDRQPDLFRRHNITGVPTFLIIDAAGNELRRVVGYQGKNDLWRNLTQECVDGVCPPSPPDPPRRPPDSGDSTDLISRLNRLQQANEALQEERDQLRHRERDLADQLSDAGEIVRQSSADQQAAAAAQRRADELQLQITDIVRRQQAAEAAAARAEAEAEDLRRRLELPAAPPWNPPEQNRPPDDVWGRSGTADGSRVDAGIESGGGISAEIPDVLFPVAATTGDKWLRMLTKVGQIGLTLAAPEASIPLTAAAAVVWYGLSRRRRAGYRPAAGTPGGRISEPSTVRVDTERRTTENHYVVKETDARGEAYAEALRRVAAARKSDQPGIVDVIRQIEHVAGELLRGRKIVDRPQQQPRPGLWSDPDEVHISR